MPGAWVINFTNPAGMVTEALQQVLGDRVVGICDSPSGLCRRVARAVGHSPEDMWFDYFGLNHLGWLRGARTTPTPTGCRSCSPTTSELDHSRRGGCSAATGCARSA